MAYSIRGLTLMNPGAPAGGRVYSYYTSADAIATVVASGYFNSVASQIASGDTIMVSSTDVTRICRMVNTANVITVGAASSLA